MALHDLLNKLDGVKQTGPSRWIAKCAAHNDKRPSLTITEKDDGMVLIKCWAGCGATEILGALGLEFDALFPAKTADHRGKPVRRPWNPADLLKVMAFEATVVFLAAAALRSGKPLSGPDMKRLTVATGRLQAASEACNG